MQQARYFWSATPVDKFTNEDILTHLEGINMTIGELLHLRGELSKAQVPTHRLVTGIRAMEEIKELLVLMVTKKHLCQAGEFILPENELQTELDWRVFLDIFLVHCKLQIRSWYQRKKKTIHSKKISNYSIDLQARLWRTRSGP